MELLATSIRYEQAHATSTSTSTSTATATGTATATAATSDVLMTYHREMYAG